MMVYPLTVSLLQISVCFSPIAYQAFVYDRRRGARVAAHHQALRSHPGELSLDEVERIRDFATYTAVC
jgi:hypothetical protein